MKIHHCLQGGTEWLRLRMGRPTASQFHRIITPTGKPSTSAAGYVSELISELIMGRPYSGLDNLPWVQRGRDLEADARNYYQFIRDCSVETVGLITAWDERVGASPDALVGDDGLLEIKCPSPAQHAEYLLATIGTSKSIDRTYYPQLQGQLLVTGREWVDILSYHPEMPHAIIRVERDEKYIQTLTDLLGTFLDDLATARAACEAQRWIVDRSKVNCEPVRYEDLPPQVYESGDLWDEFDAAIGAGLV